MMSSCMCSAEKSLVDAFFCSTEFMLIAYRIKQVVIFRKILAFSVSFVDLQKYHKFLLSLKSLHFDRFGSHGCPVQHHVCMSAQANFVIHWPHIILSKTYTFNPKAPGTTHVTPFCRLLKCFRCLFGKQCRPRSDCSCRSRLIWVYIVCLKP